MRLDVQPLWSLWVRRRASTARCAACSSGRTRATPWPRSTAAPKARRPSLSPVTTAWPSCNRASAWPSWAGYATQVSNPGLAGFARDHSPHATALRCIRTRPATHTFEPRRLGQWTEHQKFGAQLQVESTSGAEMGATPSTAEGMEELLTSSAIKGIGPKLAAALVQAPPPLSHFAPLATSTPTLTLTRSLARAPSTCC